MLKYQSIERETLSYNDISITTPNGDNDMISLVIPIWRKIFFYQKHNLFKYINLYETNNNEKIIAYISIG